MLLDHLVIGDSVGMVMFPDLLPFEIVLEVMRHAARDFVGLDRLSVVQLALVSRSVHAVVHPILYDTLTVGSSNVHRILDLVRFRGADGRRVHQRVFDAIWTIHLTAALVGYIMPDELTEIFAATPNLRVVDSYFWHLSFLFSPAPGHPIYWATALPHEGIQVRARIPLDPTLSYGSDFAVVLDDLRLTGPLAQHQMYKPVATHIALGWEDEDLPVDRVMEHDFARLLAKLLEFPSIEAVAIHWESTADLKWDRVCCLAARTRDRRVHVWRDERVDMAFYTPEMWAADVRGRMDVWQHAKPVVASGLCATCADAGHSTCDQSLAGNSEHR